MPKLVIKKYEEIIAVYDLDFLPANFSVGSAPDNDIVISDSSINMSHLQFQREDRTFSVQNVWGVHGTFYNGEELTTTTTLNDGDLLEIGVHTLLYQQQAIKTEPLDHQIKSDIDQIPSDKKAAPKIDFASYDEEKLDAVKEGLPVSARIEKSATVTIAEKAIEPTQKSAHPRYCLLAISGPYFGKRFFLDDESIRLGLNPKTQEMVLRKGSKGDGDAAISERHATIQLKNNAFIITDNGTRLGTYLNGKRLIGDSKSILKPGDEIEVVSKVKSGIYRVTEYGNWDFSPPRVAGSWWIRSRRIVLLVCSLFITIVCLLLLIKSCTTQTSTPQAAAELEAQAFRWWRNDSKNAPAVKLDESGFAYTAGLSLCDLNRDGIPDLMFVNAAGDVLAINGSDKTPIWPKLDVDLLNSKSVAFSDLNADDIIDVLTLCSDHRLRKFNGSTGELMSTSMTFDDEIVGRPVTADLDRDGETDIILVGKNGSLHIGISEGWTQKWQTTNFFGDCRVEPFTADINGDDHPEIFISSDDGVIYIYSFTLDELRSISISEQLRRARGAVFAEQTSVRSPVTVGQFNDNRVTLVTATLEYSIIALELNNKTRETTLMWYSDDRATERQLPTYQARPVLIDLEGDSKTEVVLASHNGTVKVFANEEISGKSFPVWSFPTDENPLDAFVIEPSFIDINGDGTRDVVIAGLLGRLYVLNGKDGTPLLNIFLSEYPISTTPVTGDVNRDGMLEILVMDANHEIYQVQTNTLVSSANIARPSSRFKRRIILILIMIFAIAPHVIFWWRRKHHSRFYF